MQAHVIDAWLAANASDASVTVYDDSGYSGKNTSRPAFQRLRGDIAAGLIDEVVIYRLDRLSRNTLDLMETLIDWTRRGICFTVADQPAYNALFRDNPFRMSMLSIFADLAQIERDVLSQRTKSGLAAAKARGVRIGAPKKVTAEVVARVKSLRAQHYTYRKIAKAVGIAPTTVGEILNGRIA